MKPVNIKTINDELADTVKNEKIKDPDALSDVEKEDDWSMIDAGNPNTSSEDDDGEGKMVKSE